MLAPTLSQSDINSRGREDKVIRRYMGTFHLPYAVSLIILSL